MKLTYSALAREQIRHLPPQIKSDIRKCLESRSTDAHDAFIEVESHVLTDSHAGNVVTGG